MQVFQLPFIWETVILFLSQQKRCRQQPMSRLKQKKKVSAFTMDGIDGYPE